MASPASAWQYISPNALPSDSLSDSCNAALVVDLECPSQVGSFFEREPVPLASLQEACTSACRTSLANFEASLQKACGVGDVVEYELGSDPVHISVVATDLYYHFTRTCIRDGDRWCNVWAFENSPDNKPLAGGPVKASITPTVNMCDNCIIKPFQFQAGTSYSNGYVLQQAYISLTKSCSKAGFPLKTTVTDNPLTTTTTPIPEPCSGDVYTIKAGDSCASISKANNVATSWMLYDNGLQSFCHGFPSAGKTICIKNKCKTYTIQSGDTCQSIAAAAKISLVQLYTWNPVLGQSCSRLSLSVGHTICLEPHDDNDYKPITRTITSKPPGATAAPVPSNIADRTNKNCALYYSVEVGDYCNQVIMKFSIPLPDFLFLNQGVNKECTNLFAKESYCVSPLGPIDMYPGHPDYVDPTTAVPNINFNDLPKATFTAPVITSVPTNLPRAKGTRRDCTIFIDGSDLQVDMSWGFAFSACQRIADMWEISLDELKNWNPSLNTTSSLCAFEEKYSYCMAAYQKVNTFTGEPDESLLETTKTTPATASNGVSTPGPIQSGMVSNCNKFHIVSSTTTCQGIANYHRISLSDFYKWNPQVKPDCSNLVLGAYTCAGIIETTSQSVTTNPTTTANGISTPTPAQPGMVSNCNKFHIIKSTTTCQGIVDYNKITTANLLKWNTGINSGCTNLGLGNSVCVGVIGGVTPDPTTTKPTSGVPTPTPIQPGMTEKCTKWHPVKSTTTCQGILSYNKITLAQFYKWNPAVKSDCSNLWPDTWACIAGP
ncbi:uncharacterized protein FTOL_07565 [Fusarium torulosum]|uniref:LysM domain-containing protein n=1 Tax=Fusarium torulosum TaxID=33205 RepID=A0AAE8MB14_9HYPO|nr:uncharacterized protein FTOL_07565 [Fusarium torulosum]